jgi:peptidoglycan-N-acetylglucosamine deacetylase
MDEDVKSRPTRRREGAFVRMMTHRRRDATELAAAAEEAARSGAPALALSGCARRYGSGAVAVGALRGVALDVAQSSTWRRLPPHQCRTHRSGAVAVNPVAVVSAATGLACRRVLVVTVMLLFVTSGCGSSKQSTRSPSSTTITQPPSSTTIVRSTTTTTTPAGRSTSSVASSKPAVVVRHGNEHRRWIALTFDAGSDAGNTAIILDLLAARHVRATFVLTGAWARANPQLALRIARDGHVIANHTDSHRSFTGFSTHTPALSSTERAAELNNAEASIIATTGTSTRPWYRPPYGDFDAATPVDVARSGYRYVLLWTVDSLGWKGLPPAEVAARCLHGATPGGILLLHVGSASTDAAALPRILDGLHADRYALTTVAVPGFVAP